MKSPHLLVERALSLVPDSQDFQPLREAVVRASQLDREKIWARSGVYATLGKRVSDPARVRELIPSILEETQRRLSELFALIVEAIEAEEAGEPARAAELLIRAGEREEADRRPREAASVYRLALEVAANLREKGPHILALRRLGRILRSMGQLEEAWDLYEQSYTLSVDQRDREGQAIACQGLGNLCDDRGDRECSRAWYERGLELARELERPAIIWPFYTNLAVIELQTGSLDRAESLLSKARDEIARIDDPSAMMYWCNNRGLLLLRHRDFPAAEKVLREGLSRAEDPFWEMVLRINLANALIRQGRLFEAEEEARRAEEIAILDHYLLQLVDIYDVLGSIARERQDEDGFVFYEQALSLARDRDLPKPKEALIYHGYGRLHLACGHQEEGIACLERAWELYDSLGLVPERERVAAELEDSSAPPAAPLPAQTPSDAEI